MNIKRFIEPETCTQTYLIIIDGKSSVIIDSVKKDVDLYLDFIQENNLSLKYVFDTHIHADHITGAHLLREKTGCKIVMSESAATECMDIKLSDGQEFIVDNLTIKVISTPGHTSESCCYLIEDRLFTGDTLLINACGRTDFQNGSSIDLYNSLFNKVLTLPDETIVYPGHDYNGRTVSTIYEEKRNNPRLQVADSKEFINIMDNLNLPNPKYIDIAVPHNLVCGADI